MVNYSVEIKVISECFVRPEHEVEAAKQPYYLGLVDLFMLSIDPIQKGLLFPFQNNPTRLETETRPLVERLKHSLSIALVHFYPLAGRFETIKYEHEHACLIYVDCTKGPGARLIHATMDLTVSDILSSTDVHPAVRSFFDLGDRTVNHDGHTKPLLSIQVTELLDGVFIGFTMNHSVVDGTSFIHFVSTLSKIFRSDDKVGENPIQISKVPIYKMYVPDGSGPIFKLPYLKPEEFVIRYVPGQLRVRIFHFSPESMARLKAKANEKCGTTQEISSYMALTSLVWRSMTRARNPAGHEKASCTLLLNARPRLDPTLSENYFGNFLGQVPEVCNVDELLQQSLGWAASLLGQEVKRYTHEKIHQVLKWVADNLIVAPPGLEQPEFYGTVNNVVIGGSHRFDMYGPEFGLGRAAAVLMGYANQDNGKVTANPGHEGRGSVDLEICFRPQFMDALEADEEFMSYVSLG